MESYKWPSDEELKKALLEIDKAEPSRPLPPNSAAVDRLKYELCKCFIIYRQDSELSQKELADKIGIDPALMSKILKKRFDEFTIDRLVRYLEVLDIKVTLKAA